jgi:hypothetical protein
MKVTNVVLLSTSFSVSKTLSKRQLQLGKLISHELGVFLIQVQALGAPMAVRLSLLSGLAPLQLPFAFEHAKSVY